MAKVQLKIVAYKDKNTASIQKQISKEHFWKSWNDLDVQEYFVNENKFLKKLKIYKN